MIDRSMNPKAVLDMRNLIESCEEYASLWYEESLAATSLDEDNSDTDIICEDVFTTSTNHPIMGDLMGLLDDWRAHYESEGGQYGTGVEDGMSRAADMLERLIKRHEGI